MGKQKYNSGGSRKIHRSLEKCALYRKRKTREKNKVRKINKHLRSHPNDKQSIQVVKKLELFIIGKI